MSIETKTVTIEDICAEDRYVGFVIDLANAAVIGNPWQHYTLLKDLIRSRVGWRIPPDKPVAWWMRSQAAYEVAVGAVSAALNLGGDEGPKEATR